MAEPEFEEKFVAFIDMLGFKAMIEEAEAGKGRSLVEIIRLADILKNDKNTLSIRECGATFLPNLRSLNFDLSVNVTQISDCVIISYEKSPAGAVNIISHCYQIYMKMLSFGILMRGFITRGPVYHTDKHIFGSGYQKAYAHERNTTFQSPEGFFGTPFVEIDKDIISYIEENLSEKERRIAEKMYESINNVCALYPFKNIASIIFQSDHYYNQNAAAIIAGIEKISRIISVNIDNNENDKYNSPKNIKIELMNKILRELKEKIKSDLDFMNVPYPA